MPCMSGQGQRFLQFRPSLPGFSCNKRFYSYVRLWNRIYKALQICLVVFLVVFTVTF